MFVHAMLVYEIGDISYQTTNEFEDGGLNGFCFRFTEACHLERREANCIFAYICGSGGHALLFSLFNLSHPLSLLNLKAKLNYLHVKKFRK